MKRKVANFFLYLFIFISILLLFSSIWVHKKFGLINYDSLLYTISNGLEGTESGMINSYILYPFMSSILIIFSIMFFNYFFKKELSSNIPVINIVLFNKIKKEINIFFFVYSFRIVIAIIIFCFCFICVIFDFKFIDYLKNRNDYSLFIEENYSDPKTTNIEFKEKRNLIHIFVESLEYTYADKQNGGAFDYNLIPNLTELKNNNTSFTNSFGGGFYNPRGTGWTAGGMVGQTSGIGLFTTLDGNSFGDNDNFLPGVYSLGDVLEENGYKNVLFIGSDADFGNRRSYFVNHGNYEIKDYNYAIRMGYIPEDYFVWWGYEDSKLFEFAKKEIINLSKENQPFNFTMLTTNTHHGGGYLEPDSSNIYEVEQFNIIVNTDKQLYEFINWIKDQDFYENTTIVVTGDHLSMEPDLFNNLGDYRRTNFNLFINPYRDALNKNNRLFSTFDIYPTIIDSIGGVIEGDRLGLGTDLFSNKQTLYEQFGIDVVEIELNKNSLFYTNKIK